jgi:adenosylhomocysteine nucleosidase
MLGIIGAMNQEVDRLKAEMTEVTIEERASMSFYVGKLHGKDVVIVRSGVGKVNAAVCTQILADDYGVSAVINTGVAGSLNPKIDIGDIVVSVDAVQHDMDATVWGYRPGEIPQSGGACEFKADERLRQILAETCREVNPDIKVFEGRVASGDQFISDNGKKEELVRVFKADCAEMEGASIAQAAWVNGIPFAIIRAISDKADNSAVVQYDVFEAQAIEHCVRLVKAAVQKL